MERRRAGARARASLRAARRLAEQIIMEIKHAPDSNNFQVRVSDARRENGARLDAREMEDSVGLKVKKCGRIYSRARASTEALRRGGPVLVTIPSAVL